MPSAASSGSRDQVGKFAGWRIAILAAFIHSISYGTIFGSYGVSVVAIEERYGVSRAVAGSMASLMMGALIFSAPFLGSLYNRISIRNSIMVGALLAAAGHFVLSVSSDPRMMVASYALLIGPGLALTGSMATNVLVTRWFRASQGKAFGIVNLPVGLMIAPLGAAVLLERGGLTMVYAVSGMVLLTIIPAAWWLVDSPQKIRQLPEQEEAAQPGAGDDAASGVGYGALLTRQDFWIITFAIGVIIGAASMKQAHLVPLLMEQGHSMQFASSLLALSSGAGAMGSLVVGWLADRFGGLRVLLVNAGLQALMWWVFLLPVSASILAIDAIVIGACGGGVSAAQGVLVSRYFGAANFGKSLGLISVAAAPLLLGLNSMAGVLRDRTGGYREAVLMVIIATFIAALALAVLSRRSPAASSR